MREGQIWPLPDPTVVAKMPVIRGRELDSVDFGRDWAACPLCGERIFLEVTAVVERVVLGEDETEIVSLRAIASHRHVNQMLGHVFAVPISSSVAPSP